jgi:hypothetical protein
MFRKAMLGDTATLNLDFTTGTLDSRLTFTRAANTATYINSSGYVTTATANTPRFDYDPVTLAPRGLLIEGTAVNIIKGSETIAGTEWSSSTPNFTVTLNTTDLVAPNNTNTATKLVFVSGYARAVQTNITVVASTTYTLSYWIKSTGVCNWKIYNATGGTFIVENVAIPASAEWQRITKTFTTPVGCTSIWAYVADAAATGTYYVWGAQLELGSGASSYIPTVASQVTRNGDSCVMTGTNFSSWFAGATEGVLFAEYEKPRSQSGNAAHDFSAVGSRYTTGAGFILYAGNSNYYPTTILWPTGGAIFGGGIATAIPSVTKQAGKWFGGNDVTNYSNGVVGTTVAGTGTITPAMLSFGANSATGTEATRDWLNACIRQVKFYPTALSDAAIQTLTAL